MTLDRMHHLWTRWFGNVRSRNSAGKSERDQIAQSLDQHLPPSHVASARWQLEHFQLESVLGSGGIGVVVRGYDACRQRTVAVKLLRPEFAKEERFCQRFIHEGRVAMRVYHPHVVIMHAVHRWEALPFLVMEYVDGGDLAQRIESAGPLATDTIVRWGNQMAQGLAAIHAKGLIHNDLKPSNILIASKSDAAKISDFGLARILDSTGTTRQSNVFGSVHFISPEQAAGRTLDARSDLYSFGSVLYAMVTGQPPFPGDDTLAVLRKVQSSSPRPITEFVPHAPNWLVELIDRLMQKSPKARPRSAEELRLQFNYQQRLSATPAS